MILQIAIGASVPDVWSHLADLRSHADWMGDAEEVSFQTPQTSGVGTTMRVPTRVGPFRTTDLLTVIEWEENRVMTVTHEGTVTGTGRFEMYPSPTGTTLTWAEDLRFPWWLGGPVGAFFGGLILRPIWKRNLARFKSLVEDRPG
ncbi:MAG: SRPBCC family protein [Acidobacteria bacterium]|nr:SRPBCC family protein [Acidobacteriota bacterium]